ncbi:MAG: aldolase/citrate lyase family protein [Erysipelotrichia bacterium]|nr:aldolase/citrate lyase family protein [Erysipelotrichia bacterium]
MSLKLMYITNNPSVARIAQDAGVDRIFIDMEYIGKEERQAGLNTVKLRHNIKDIENIRKVLTKSELLVRVNSIHNKTDKYCSSEEEIDNAINTGADVLMLPMFKTAEDVKRFVQAVDGRAKVVLLLENRQAVENLDEILNVDGIDEIHIGLNDLHLSYGMKFMFELLADGTVDRLCNKIHKKNIPYGFGGIARIGYGLLPAEYVIKEHYRLGSSCAILSRAFCNVDKIDEISEIERIFNIEIKSIRNAEKYAESMTEKEFENNHKTVVKLVNEIVEKM